MKKIKLGDVLDVKRGVSLSGEYYSEEGRFIRLTLGNFNYPNGGFKQNSSKSDLFYTGPVKKEFILKKGDIITPLTEQVAGLLGETATIPEDNLYIQCGDVGLILPDEAKLAKRFAYYLVSSPAIKKQLGAAAQQTKIRHTSPDTIKACKAWIPEKLSDQKRIAGLLDSINESISINTNICIDLEAMAKLLYDYWFVQFDFPDENGKPYKSNGGKMVWNEQLKRKIPERWRSISLETIARIDTTTVIPQSNTMYQHYSIPAFDESEIPSCEKGDEINSNKYLVPTDSVLVSKLNPQFKRIWLIGKVKEDAICSTEFMPFISLNNHKAYLYSLLNSAAFYTYMVQSSSSSTGSRKRMEPELCLKFEIAYPQESRIINEYTRIVSPLLQHVQETKEENQQLKSLRDFLLPMLMNGQVKVRS